MFVIMRWGAIIFFSSLAVCLPVARAVVDGNGNGQSDVWEMIFGATNLAPNADADGDGFSNAAESIAGTNPFDANSYPHFGAMGGVQTGRFVAAASTLAGKMYTLEAANDPKSPWVVITNVMGSNAMSLFSMDITSLTQHLFRVRVGDVDSDGDGVSDWEELQLGLDPHASNTQRSVLTDYQRVSTTLNAQSSVSLAVLDGDMHERWPDDGVFAIRRAIGMKPLTVNFTVGGTAVRGVDYSMPAGNSITVPAGSKEVWLPCTPVPGASGSTNVMTVTLTLTAGSNYVLGTTTGTLYLTKEPTNASPCPKAAARFLLQAAFGPDAASTNDPALLPANVRDVMNRGFTNWIEDQFTRPVGTIGPFTHYAPLNFTNFYYDPKECAWWNRAMGVTNLVPGGPTILPDLLRQRVAFALSQIFVVSDANGTLQNEPDGLANYYDMLLTNSFGNFRSILYGVTLHPCMGIYLSFLRNEKPDPVNNIFPDENYAREVMQLFTVGLWQLNQDGTQRLDTNGLPVPTYYNSTITEFARVFTGFAFGGTGTNSFSYGTQDLTAPMKMWDAYHDTNSKALLNGTVLPARVASSPDTGATGMLDINAALDNIFWHTNVAPFISRKLIQRLVTSNPSTGYLARVSAAFNNNGSGVRGDMKAVIRAILLDAEARDPAMMSNPSFGKLREPFLKIVNFGHAFNAASSNGYYALDNYMDILLEEPVRSPSVFNFYKPDYIPPGAIAGAGLVGPEFQIVNASSSMTSLNYFDNAVRNDMSRWGESDSSRAVRPDLAPYLALVNDPDAMIRRLDLCMTYGRLEPRNFQIITEAVKRVTSYNWDWQNERVYLAIYLMTMTPEFSVLR